MSYKLCEPTCLPNTDTFFFLHPSFHSFFSFRCLHGIVGFYRLIYDIQHDSVSLGVLQLDSNLKNSQSHVNSYHGWEETHTSRKKDGGQIIAIFTTLLSQTKDPLFEENVPLFLLSFHNIYMCVFQILNFYFIKCFECLL